MKFVNIINNQKILKSTNDYDLGKRNRNMSFYNGSSINASNIKSIEISDVTEDMKLLISGEIGKLILNNLEIDKLNIINSRFKSLPNFDDKSSIKNSVDIDKKSFDNLLNIEKAGSLEFSRLAEFFNRNNAYMEAQPLHRHYLLEKAKESKNYGLKFWVWFYSLVNGCGTSLLKPFIGVLYCWLFTYLIFLSLSIKLVMSVKSTGVIVYSSYSVLFSIKQALLVTVPLLATIHKPEIEMLDNGLLQIFVNFLMIVSYLLVFLMALQIRKLLRLKD
ncbi:hypothetical protein IB671_05040 [Francisella orientalis]|uniref:hypothetical protein n=1 Tax=Francisella orientalis TaxID=299583 RepID=UPI00190545B8|nr:hypothetical protein [Francisella orientalis]MBK2075188.1 hypothetical protein [Francisella orientalis]